MDISFVALDRIFENHMAKDKKAYKDAVAKGRGALLFGRRMTDDELLAKLRSCGIVLDRELFAELCPSFLSAEDLSTRFITDRRLKLGDIDDDWLWVCLTVLWERWLPDSPSFEMIDDAMQEGYARMAATGAAGAVEIWLPVWKRIQAIMDSQGMKTVGEFDVKFRGSQSVSNWVQDIEMELHNAGIDDPAYCSENILFCEEVIPRLGEEQDLTIENMRRSIGDAYAQMGDTRKSDDLFGEWLAADPRWGWGWIGWADCYSFWKRKGHDLGRAAVFLKQGLAVSGVRDKRDMLERQMNVYEDMGRKDDAGRIQEELSRDDDIQETTEVSVHGNVLSVKTKVNYGGMGMPLEEWSRGLTNSAQEHLKKIGRNDPCPCGSGKKYKKCCGG